MFRVKFCEMLPLRLKSQLHVNRWLCRHHWIHSRCPVTFHPVLWSETRRLPTADRQNCLNLPSIEEVVDRQADQPPLMHFFRFSVWCICTIPSQLQWLWWTVFYTYSRHFFPFSFLLHRLLLSVFPPMHVYTTQKQSIYSRMALKKKKAAGGELCFQGVATLWAAWARLQVRYFESELSLGIVHCTSKKFHQANGVSLLLAFATVLSPQVFRGMSTSMASQL